jgi:hypothetical protein
LVAWRLSPGGIRAQRYDAGGFPIGPEQVVSSQNEDASPAVEPLRDGRFLVVWYRLASAGSGVVGRVLDAAGVPSDGEISIAPEPALLSRGPDLAFNANGRGLVTWAASDGDAGGVFARRLRVDGTPRNESFRVNTYTTGGQVEPRVASSRPLRFVVVWKDDASRDGEYGTIIGQQLNRLGRPLGTEFVVNTYTTGDQAGPDVAGGSGRTFVVVWQSASAYVGPESPGIRAQRFGPRARKLEPELTVSTFEGPHFSPSIAATDDGEFVVVWGQGGVYTYPFGCDYGSFSCQDGVGLGVIAQRLDAEGGKIGSEQVVTNDPVLYDQLPGGVASAGEFVVAWTDAGCLRAENYTCRYFHSQSFVDFTLVDSGP